jgi:hypothetical protein
MRARRNSRWASAATPQTSPAACHGPLSEAQLKEAAAKHRVPPSCTVVRYALTYACAIAMNLTPQTRLCSSWGR